MSIDRQRIEAVRVVEALGHKYAKYAGGKWAASSGFKGTTLLSAEGDVLYALQIQAAAIKMAAEVLRKAIPLIDQVEAVDQSGRSGSSSPKA